MDVANYLGSIFAAIAALGFAAAGLVDSLKALPQGGISRAGFGFVSTALGELFGRTIVRGPADNLSRDLDTLHGNWINGRPFAEQQAIAKSLVKLRLDATTAAALARTTGVDPATLTTVGRKMIDGEKLTDSEMNVLGRFDLALAALLDNAYQHADQRYRTIAKFASMVMAVILAVGGGIAIGLDTTMLWGCFFAGLVATPLAPIAKDLASGLAAGVKVAQAMKR